MTARFEAELWLSPGEAGWHFVTLPGELADDIRERTRGTRAGFGSVRVRATIGATSWDTSLFPDTRRASYLLPVKADVRRREGLAAGDQARVTLDVTGLGGR